MERQIRERGRGDGRDGTDGKVLQAVCASGQSSRADFRRASVSRVAALEAEIESLRAQVRHSRLILDSALDYAIVTMDMGGCITGWSAGAERMMGYGERDVLGRPGETVLTFGDRSSGKSSAELRRAGETGRITTDGWHLRRDGTRFWASGTLMPILDPHGQARGFLNILRDRTDLRAATEQRELLMGEMNHRIKNTFAMVQAVAAQTERYSTTSAEFHASFRARLSVLARLNDMLIRADWNDTPLQDLIEAAVEAYNGETGRITFHGPPVMLVSHFAATASLAFHELVVNAVKHGAFSAPEGQVDVSWTVAPGQDGSCSVDLVWRESGGPVVEPPEHYGFGFRLLDRGLPSSSTVKFDFRPSGLECRFRLPAIQPSTREE